MYKLNLDPKNIERLNHFKNSDYFLSTNSKSKSSYWKEHSKLLKSEVTKDKMVVSGDSGFYIPPENQPILEIFSKITKILKSPSKLIQRVKNRFFTLPKLFQYKTAFDLVLNHDVVTDPDLSPYRINHLLWKKENDLFLSSDVVKSDFENWSKRKISEHIYLHYYYFNILKSFLKGKKVKTVLEIGAGNGNL
ncbi:putative sugar O-methyltransferase, partial [Leptospira levettii]|uniref:putative sugar O-methyltransferase n=1 Tax=Leptospira levettii TaxID=2023178 RepID=UPI001083F46F